MIMMSVLQYICDVYSLALCCNAPHLRRISVIRDAWSPCKVTNECILFMKRIGLVSQESTGGGERLSGDFPQPRLQAGQLVRHHGGTEGPKEGRLYQANVSNQGRPVKRDFSRQCGGVTDPAYLTGRWTTGMLERQWWRASKATAYRAVGQ